MEISRRYSIGVVELTVTGRLDGYWADHLASALDEEIRQGSHHVLLDLSQVVFLSSAGIGVLVRFYQQLKNIQGSLSVSKASERVRKVIQISGLKEVLLAKTAADTQGPIPVEGAQPASGGRVPAVSKPVAQIERPGAIFDVHVLESEAGLTCHLVGDPSLLEGSRFGKENCRALEFPDSTFAIGLGALGENFEECQSRFGEFIAAAGAVAYLPTDGTNMPDYLVAAGKSVPDVQVCYGIACKGVNARPFSTLVRFQAKKETRSATLAQLVEACLEIADSPRIGIVMVAEAAGLMGAALRRSPTQPACEHAPFEFPGVREWLTFTAERAHTRSVTLVAGVAARGDFAELAPVLRPLTSATGNTTDPVTGHFHAAAFSYRPLQKGEINLQATVKNLFEGQALESVLHLLSDDRAIAGAGQSEFIRGACWIGAIGEIAPEGDRV